MITLMLKIVCCYLFRTRSRYVTNKRFLFNTIASAVGARRLNSRKQESVVKQDEDKLTDSGSKCCSTKCPEPMAIGKLDVKPSGCSRHASDPPQRRASKRKFDLVDSKHHKTAKSDNPSSRCETVRLDESVYDVYDYINLNMTSSHTQRYSP